LVQIELIFVCLAIGILLRLSGRLLEVTPKVLGGWVINVALPAVAIRNVHDLSINYEWLFAAFTPWLTAGFALLVIIPISIKLRWSRRRLGALLLVAGWGNTSFVGLPMITAYFGSQWLGLGLFIDLFGSYLSLSILGIAIATVCNSNSFDWKITVRRIITFPPLIAIVIAVATNHLDRPARVDEILDILASTMTPIALAAVGYAIRFKKLYGRFAPLGVGLTYRLIISPLVIALLYIATGHINFPEAHVTIFEAAMPPMLGASIIAIDNDLEPDLVGLLIGIGIPLSMATTAGWWYLLNYI